MRSRLELAHLALQTALMAAVLAAIAVVVIRDREDLIDVLARHAGVRSADHAPGWPR